MTMKGTRGTELPLRVWAARTLFVSTVKSKKRTADSPSAVVPLKQETSRATRAIIPKTPSVRRSMVKRRDTAEKSGGCWRRETADLSSPALREISSNPNVGGEEGETGTLSLLPSVSEPPPPLKDQLH